MPPLILLSLLGAMALGAVSSMPVDKGDHIEEMVTRCIVEVLSNALSRPNAPPINPECKKILKKSGQQDKDETENESENSKFAVRLLRDPTNGETHAPMSLEEENPEEKESKRQMEEDTEKLQQEEEGKEGRGKYQPSLHLHEDQGLQEARKHQPENSNEKEKERVGGGIEKYKKNDHSEEGSQEKPLYEESGEIQNTFLEKRNQAKGKITEEFAAQNNRYSVEHPEKTHSQERSSEESEEESEDNSSEKRGWEPTNQQRSVESDESEEASVSEVTKRRLKPRHHHRRYRLDQSFEEKKAHSEERRNTLESEESNEDKDHFWDKRGHHKSNYEDLQEEPSYHEEKWNYRRSHGPDDLEEERYSDRASEEYRDKRHHNEENQQEEEKRNHHNRQIEEARHHYDGEREEGRHFDEDKSLRGNRDDKRYPSERQHYAKESNMDNERRHPRGRKEQDRSYLDHDKRNSEEGDIGKWQQREDEDGENNREEARFQEKGFDIHRAEEKMKRLGIPYSPYYEPLQWKNKHFEEKERIPMNEEESRSSLNEKTFFPDYNDYDWWDKKPFVEDTNQEHNEKRNLIGIPKYDLKKQYDRVDELAQLLNYRKKSDEFPEFYNSDEDMRKHQMVRNENGGLSQRPLTEEEEKELENLAAMDMELQKIAEKFSGTQRG
ncbi:secretogranin-1 [Dromiciops gliroides]|uniref:secretogranin-1 n=1 Tax=Dromiciops gliroides TaxID=33562 RepID=UPI001CC3C685|nr:secretogranin-1 [Dromiciops gliroides]XP_043843363.1 secretogranin-1 [Dromiciops gliroides]